MTKEEIGKLAIELIQAEIDGKIVEARSKYDSKRDGAWFKRISPFSEKRIRGFDFDSFDYRIKPEKKLVPFAWEDRELLTGKWVRRKDFNHVMFIYDIDDKRVNNISYYDLYCVYTFLDGSPCGKEVEK